MSISITNVAMLLRVKIGGKTFQTTDRSLSDELTAEKEASSDSAKVIKSLLGGKCQLLLEIQKIAATTRMGIKNRTVPYHFPGVDVMSVHSWEDTLRYVKQQQALYEDALDKFIEAYPRLVEEAKVKSGKLFNGTEHYPSPEALKSQLSFEYHVEPIPDNNMFDKILNLSEQAARLKESLESRMNETLDSITETLRGRILERVKVLSDRVHNGDQKRIRYKGIFKKTVEVMNMVQSLNITDDSRITDWAQRIKSIVDHDPDVVRQDVALRNSMSHDLNVIQREMGSEVIESVESTEEVEEPAISDEVYEDALNELLS